MSKITRFVRASVFKEAANYGTELEKGKRILIRNPYGMYLNTNPDKRVGLALHAHYRAYGVCHAMALAALDADADEIEVIFNGVTDDPTT